LVPLALPVESPALIAILAVTLASAIALVYLARGHR
jgi:hypothetical protein